MKIYGTTNNTKVIVTDKNPIITAPSSPKVISGDIIMIEHMDGKYCRGINDRDEVVYIDAWTEIELFET